MDVRTRLLPYGNNRDRWIWRTIVKEIITA